ncbi:MAG: hypothetical protein COU66_02125 [Candidatus Pacebacteria bacterium CG10_big_fil_rev_8_21_14_0_10_44_11]|nr:MAG: hypothetical protein COU66_02125 [Candidatus Pacebacteria bacterium CG10_big_fil_rev_8_21_14_0_10_44_11]
MITRQQLEQSVFQNLRSGHTLSFYNKDGASEIDFIVNSKTALEVKFSMSQRDIKTLKQRSASLGVSENYIVTQHYNEHPDAILVTDM